jgi:hypothetical protein
MLIIGQVSKPELLANLFYLQAKYAVFSAKYSNFANFWTFEGP